MNILEQQFNQFSDVERLPANDEIVKLMTPCGVSVTAEPMYNLATEMYDHVMYVFDHDIQITVDSGEDSFHEAYSLYRGVEFDEIQIPVEVKTSN